MGFAIVVHDGTLIADTILDGGGGRNHFARSAEMIELAAWQRHHCDRQLAQFGVVNKGMCA